jgi:hypothetical protein
MHMHAQAQSDAQRFTGAALLLLGTSGMAGGLAFLAIRFGWGHPLLERPLIGVLLSCLLGLVGYRVASGHWTGSSQMPHQALALGGFLFLVALLAVRLEQHSIPATVRLTSLAASSVALIGSWYWRAHRRRRRRAA